MHIPLCTGLRLFGLQSHLARCTQERVLTHQASAPDLAHLPSDSASWRPQVHYTPDQNWLNDPNGLFRDQNGLWHMYYQCKSKYAIINLNVLCSRHILFRNLIPMATRLTFSRCQLDQSRRYQRLGSCHFA